MKRLSLALASAAALGAAPAFAQDAGETYDEDDLIPMTLVSEDELTDAVVYWSDGDRMGEIVGWDTDGSDISTLLVHEIRSVGDVAARYRITGEDVIGFHEDQETVVLRLDQDGYDDAYGDMYD